MIEIFPLEYKPFVLAWMKRVGALEVVVEGKKVLVYEPKTHLDKQHYIDFWLEGDITSEQFQAFLESRCWWVQYYLDDFLEEIKNVRE